jgi:hypothetical protein
MALPAQSSNIGLFNRSLAVPGCASVAGRLEHRRPNAMAATK